MALVATRVLIINSQLNVSISLKQALESTGRFEVVPFTSAGAALDYLQMHPQDVAVVDLTLAQMPGADVVLRLRAIQPDLAIIASPRRPDVVAIVQDLDLQGVVDMPASARELIPLIENAVAEMREMLPDTAEAPAVSGDSETLMIAPPDEPEQPRREVPLPPDMPEFSSLDSVLVKLGGLEPSGSETPAANDEEPEAPSDVESDVTPVSAGRPPVEVVFDQPPEVPPTPKTGDIFEKLASEEPPLPSLEDSGTVSDLMIGVDNTKLREVMAILQASPQTGGKPHTQKDTPPSEDIPAIAILETALDDTTPLEGFSLNELLANIERQVPEHNRRVRPPPSWMYDSDKYVREPDFLPDVLPADEHTEEYTGGTTSPSAAEARNIAAHPESLETEPIESARRSRPVRPGDVVIPPPPAALPEFPGDTRPHPATRIDEPTISEGDTARGAVAKPPVSEPTIEEGDTARGEAASPTGKGDLPDVDTVVLPKPPPTLPEGMDESFTQEVTITEAVPLPDADQHTADFERLGTSELTAAAEPPTEAAPASLPIEPEEDPYLAQLAVSLTQASLELTAEATLLAREGKIVAYAGSLPIEEVTELRDAVADDWSANPQQPRIRFITLPSSGKNYMVYSRRTLSEFTLSMIFGGNMPIRVIRRQSDRLVDALQAVPEMPAEPVAPPAPPAPPVALAAPTVAVKPAPAAALAPYAYLWLVRDPAKPLNEWIAQSISGGLKMQLGELGWGIKTLDVQEDYIYLLADMPNEPLPNEVIDDLKRRAAQFARTVDQTLDADALWADSYLVLAPGRELTVEEIQRFIHFARGG